MTQGTEDALTWRFHPTQSIEVEKDGSLRVKSSGMLESPWHLFTWADKIEILKPKRLKTVMTELELAARRHLEVTTVPVVDAP